MICSRCSSERSYQFEASPSERSRPQPSELPDVCRDCGLISINGRPLNLPPELEKAARGMAAAAAEEVPKATEELNEITEADWVENYMSKFFRTAYLEGFFRALAFFKHDVKRGRLLRLAKLWGEGEVMTRDSYYEEWSGKGRIFSKEAYTEFEQLLHLSAVPGEPDVKSHPHKHPAKQDDPSSLS
jgi:hypothetical protein